MMRSAAGLAALMLSACAQPAPGMWGGESIRLWRGGHEMVVVRKANRVEVIRLGYAPRASRAALRDAMMRLIPEVTGCRPHARSLRGDSGEIRARLRCPVDAPYPFTPSALE